MGFVNAVEVNQFFHEQAQFIVPVFETRDCVGLRNPIGVVDCLLGKLAGRPCRGRGGCRSGCRSTDWVYTGDACRPRRGDSRFLLGECR